MMSSHVHCPGAFAYGLSRLMIAGRLHAVLNSLSGDLTAASFALLSEASSFKEIGKRRYMWPTIAPTGRE